MKAKLLFLLKLLVISLVLFSCVGWIGRVYQGILLQVCSLFIPAGQGTIPLDYISYLRIIPFLALMLATPGIEIRRRLAVILIGLTIFIGIDAVSNITWGGFPTRQSTAPHVIFSLVWKTTGQWVLPFLFWFVAVYKGFDEMFADSPATVQLNNK